MRADGRRLARALVDVNLVKLAGGEHAPVVTEAGLQR
jgi:hypothetical protein